MERRHRLLSPDLRKPSRKAAATWRHRRRSEKRARAANDDEHLAVSDGRTLDRSIERTMMLVWDARWIIGRQAHSIDLTLTAADSPIHAL